MTTGKLKIHSENILPIIKKWLYSDRDIFTRELISNANDAIHKLKILRDKGQAEAKDEEFRIDIAIDKEAKTLTFSDTGIGMDAEEVEKYIAQIAFSGAEDFVEKYQTQNEQDQFIGHFGLGFYSAYMVADKVEIQTLSYKPDAKPVHWQCDGSPEYTLETGTREKRGTDIILHISSDNEDFLDASHLRQILKQYCEYLPHPIFLNDERLNEKEPLWMKSPSELTDNDYLEFYRHLYPMQEDPLFWVHLNVDYPFHLKGILYFPKLQKNIDLSKSSIKLFCNRVFVSDNCKDVIPEFLLPLRGAIDSPDIPLNVSRSYLQTDRTVRQLSSHISKKVADSLIHLYRNNRDKFLSCWNDLSVVVKIGAVENEKFYQKVKECLIWKKADKEWTTIEDYLELNKDKTNNKILYTIDAGQNTHLTDVYKQKGIDVLIADHPVDPYLINFLEQHIAPAAFKRLDSEIDETLIDKEREKTVLDSDGKTEAARLAEFIKSQLDEENIEVQAKSLAADQIPGIITMDENQRRLRDYMRAVDPSHQTHLMDKRTFVVNTNNPLIASIQKMNGKNPELAKDLVRQVLDLALLSQKEMDADSFSLFIQRSSRILEKLAGEAVED
jgi:molecular chaperone HtpG